jgi:hypothetical protein
MAGPTTRAVRSFLSLHILAYLVLSASAALADSPARPFWTEQAMFRFGEDLFFAGQASCAKTAEEGRQRAFRHALQELLNYAQAASANGLAIATQMVFQELDSPGCPGGTVTVWRLLRIEAEKVQKLAALTRRALPSPTPSTTIGGVAPRDLTPRLGMSREEIQERFGRPWSILLRKNGLEVSLEYPRFGLTLVLNRDNLVKNWTLMDPMRPKSGEGRRGLKRASDLDLTKRLRELETIPEPEWNVVYNRLSFPPRVRPPLLPESPLFLTEYPHTLSAKPFRSMSHSISSLMLPEYFNGLKVSKVIPAECDFVNYRISLAHLSEPAGPMFVSDTRLTDDSEAELQWAVLMISRAIGYDVRHLVIRLSADYPPFVPPFYDSYRIDALGAGMMMAVTVASAILGDPLRDDLALVGRVDDRLGVFPVDDLESRSDYCLSRKELILPGRQVSEDVVAQKRELGIRVVGVNSLLEAYQIATNHPLRRVH